jgi:hypothetical protein
MNNPEAETAAYYQPRVWLWWILATAGGWLLGSLVTYVISIALNMAGFGAILEADPAQISQSTALLLMALSLVSLLVMGVAVGALQWLVLRWHVPGINRWAIFTGLGFALGTFAFWAFMGLGVGLTQWLLLRRDLNKTQWWLVVNAVAWPVGYLLGGTGGALLGSALGSAVVGGLIGSILIGVIIGAITGAMLLWLLRENRVLLDGLRQELEGAKP